MQTRGAGLADKFPPELLQLLGTARQVLDRHINHLGSCADCGSPWPCQRARLAESALAAP